VCSHWRLAFIGLSIAVWGCVSTPITVQLPISADAHTRYSVSIDRSFDTLTVRVEFPGAAPATFGPGVRRASEALLEARVVGGARLPVIRGEIDLRSLRRGDHLMYRVDLARAASVAGLAAGGDDHWLMSPGAWLWRDRSRAIRGGALVRFELPEGVYATTPWPSAGGVWLRLDEAGFRRPGFVAFGTARPIAIQAAGVEATLVPLGQGWRLSSEELSRWLRFVVQGVSTVTGRFPADRVLLAAVPVPGSGVRFGVVRRGGGASVAFLVGRDTSLSELENSWVVWHELSHLLLPTLPVADAWFYEGLATYYQEVLRARMGLQSERRAWQNLLEGFARGAADGSPGRPLSMEATLMGQDRAYQRIYWTGTAFMLAADLALRRRGSSLDAALGALGTQTGVPRVADSSATVVARWSEGARAVTLEGLRASYADSTSFPLLAGELTALGVGFAPESGVTLDDAPERGLAFEIMRVRQRAGGGRRMEGGR